MARRLKTPEVIVALDVPTITEAVRLARVLRPAVRTMKIGSALFTRVGPQVLERMRVMGFEVMLDLKFHDIPSTVERSVRSAVHHRVKFLTVHASGGRSMLCAAVRAANSEARKLRIRRPWVIAVTVLTSAPQKGSALTREVLRLARDARAAGCDGVVASAREAALLRRRFGRYFKIICPGIRPAADMAGDQVRTATPAQAREAGADAIVIGRPITTNKNPLKKTRMILKELE